MNPSNPRELYAGMWRAERKPWTLIDASRDGGVWKTADGGDTWTRLTDPDQDNGLPSEILFGRIGLAISPADPDRVWALISAPDPHGGIWRSDDGGKSWDQGEPGSPIPAAALVLLPSGGGPAWTPTPSTP